MSDLVHQLGGWKAFASGKVPEAATVPAAGEPSKPSHPKAPPAAAGHAGHKTK